MPEQISVTSTSASTAQVSPVVLRETDSRRLVFVPLLVENPNDAAAAIKGEFIYQRKSAVNTWENIESASLNTLRNGEGYKLVLSSAETLKFFETLKHLYGFVSNQGVPMGTRELVSVPQSEVLARVRGMLDEDHVSELLQLFLTWAEEQDSGALSNILRTDDGQAVINFDAAIGAARLEQFIADARSSLQNSDESFWQDLLNRNSWAISQIYAHPIVILREKAYVGGKSIDNSGGTIVDFLYNNPLTHNALVVEIKTPTAILMKSDPYRNQVYSPSSELSGATQQILTARHTLVSDFNTLSRADNSGLQVFSPKALLIIGTLPAESDSEKRRSFEIYRNCLVGIEIVTFDEIISKAQLLLDLIQNSA